MTTFSRMNNSTSSSPAIIPFEELSPLIEKYSGSGPRYTSYPTAVEFTPDCNSETWKHELHELGSGEHTGPLTLALYAHIPFCQSLCYFCACHKEIVRNRAIVPPYLAALQEEFRMYDQLLPKERLVRQIHWGGGSPSYLTPEEARKLMQGIRKHFPDIAADADISIELDPRTTDTGKLETYREVGFNRVSLGVQDFSERVQQTINRIQSRELTAALVEQARSLGFLSVNLDLIYGLPEQTLESFEETIATVLELRPDRIALYGYAHVTWLNKVQRSFHKAHLPSPQERIEIFLLALDQLQRHGYRHIGMDHFALPSDELCRAQEAQTLHRNFMGYSTHPCSALLGFGASAISTAPGALAQNAKELPEYQALISRNRLPIVRGVARDREDQLRAYVIDELFCQQRVDFARFSERWNRDFWDVFASAQPKVEQMSDDGLVVLSRDSLAVSDRGRLFTRNIAMNFDRYLEKRLEQTKPVFSNTV